MINHKKEKMKIYEFWKLKSPWEYFHLFEALWLPQVEEVSLFAEPWYVSTAVQLNEENWLKFSNQCTYIMEDNIAVYYSMTPENVSFLLLYHATDWWRHWFMPWTRLLSHSCMTSLMLYFLPLLLQLDLRAAHKLTTSVVTLL